MFKHCFFVVALGINLVLDVGCADRNPTIPKEDVPKFSASVEDSVFMEVVWNPIYWDSGGTSIFQITIAQDGDRLEVRSVDGSFAHGGYLFTSEGDRYVSGWGIIIGAVPVHAYWGPVFGDYAAEGVAVRCPPGTPLCRDGHQQQGGFRIFRK